MRQDSDAHNVDFSPTSTLRSSELARLAGTTPRALRHYHALGLLPEAARDTNGYRRYSTADLIRVIQIRQLANAGVPLRKISGLLADENLTNIESTLEQVDAELERQAELIERQRQIIRILRQQSALINKVHGSKSTSPTKQFDMDFWSMASAVGNMNATTTSRILEALGDDSIQEHMRSLQVAFTSLENRSTISESETQQLAQQMGHIAERIAHILPAEPEAGSSRLPVLTDQLQTQYLSPAQRAVWSAFVALYN